MARLLELEDLPIRVGARGVWLHGTVPLHPRVQTLFAKHVVPRLDGRYFVVLGMARQQLEVDDTAFFVTQMTLHHTPADAAAPPAHVTLCLSDGQQETLQPSTLMQAATHVLYCRIVRHGLAVPCRFSAEQYHQLMLSSAVHDATLRFGSSDYTLAPYKPGIIPVF